MNREFLQNWDDFIAMVIEDASIANDVCSKLYHENKSIYDLFRQWREDPPVYIYSFKRYQRSSDAKFTPWINIF